MRHKQLREHCTLKIAGKEVKVDKDGTFEAKPSKEINKLIDKGYIEKVGEDNGKAADE